MNLTPTGVEMIKMFEGLRLAPYKDEAGVLTVGYGHTGKDIIEGQAITKEEADTLFKADIGLVEYQVTGAVDGIAPFQFDALTSFCYNLGFGALLHSTLLELVKLKKFREASQQFGRWIYVAGKKNSGLRRRRFAEQVRFLGGDFEAVHNAWLARL